MRLVIQRVLQAGVTIDGEKVAGIGRGIWCFWAWALRIRKKLRISW